MILVEQGKETECVANNKLSSFGFVGFLLNIVNAVMNLSNNINNDLNSNNNNNNDNNQNANNANQVTQVGASLSLVLRSYTSVSKAATSVE